MKQEKSIGEKQPETITIEEFKDDVMNALFGNNRQAFEQKQKEAREKKKDGQEGNIDDYLSKKALKIQGGH